MTPELRARFPYMFEATLERPHLPQLVVEFNDGWIGIFTRLCEAVDAALLPEEKPRFRWRQAKEKWGGARFYWGLVGRAPMVYADFFFPDVGTTTVIDGPDDDVAQRLMPLIKAAEEEAACTCEWCGARPAAIDRTGGHWMTLCVEHADERQRTGELPC